MPPVSNQELTLQTSGSKKEEDRRVSGRSYAEAGLWYPMFSSTHEELQEKAHNQDLQIQQLLLQYDRLQADNKIRQWINKSHPQAFAHNYGEYPSVDKFSPCLTFMKTEQLSAINGCREVPPRKTHPLFSSVSRCYELGHDSLTDRFLDLPSRAYVPEIVKHCALYPEEIVELFAL
jgi:hypothetical protein